MSVSLIFKIGNQIFYVLVSTCHSQNNFVEIGQDAEEEMEFQLEHVLSQMPFQLPKHLEGSFNLLNSNSENPLFESAYKLMRSSIFNVIKTRGILGLNSQAMSKIVVFGFYTLYKWQDSGYL